MTLLESSQTFSRQNTVSASHSFHLPAILYLFICQCLHLSLDLSLDASVLTNFILYHLSVVCISLSSIFLALSHSVLPAYLRGVGSAHQHHREVLIALFLYVSSLVLTV